MKSAATQTAPATPVPAVAGQSEKTSNARLALGTVFVIIGLLLLLAGGSMAGESCSNSATAAALLGLPTCSSVVATFLSLVIIGIVLLIIGLVFFAKRKVSA